MKNMNPRSKPWQVSTYARDMKAKRLAEEALSIEDFLNELAFDPPEEMPEEEMIEIVAHEAKEEGIFIGQNEYDKISDWIYANLYPDQQMEALNLRPGKMEWLFNFDGGGWNAVYAASKKEALEALKKKMGDSKYKITRISVKNPEDFSKDEHPGHTVISKLSNHDLPGLS